VSETTTRRFPHNTTGARQPRPAIALIALLAVATAGAQPPPGTPTPDLQAAPAAAHTDSRMGADAAAELAAMRAENQRLKARIRALEARDIEQAALNRRLEALRARLPTPEGGSITVEAARAQAAADAAALAEWVEKARGIDNPTLWREVRRAENALHHSQYLLARADGARTVYRTRPGDSLAQISLMFHGSAEHWTELFDANRHVLPDPNRLPPGITLVVP
jgi:nucleoid-associated protein YgaU